MRGFTETVPDPDLTVVAYAAAGTDEKGFPQVRLITSWKDLKGFRLNESVELSEGEVAPFQKELKTLVRLEYDPTRAAPRLVKQNERAGRAQRLMNLLTINEREGALNGPIRGTGFRGAGYLPLGR